jgi:hypothetical protein
MGGYRVRRTSGVVASMMASTASGFVVGVATAVAATRQGTSLAPRCVDTRNKHASAAFTSQD